MGGGELPRGRYQGLIWIARIGLSSSDPAGQSDPPPTPPRRGAGTRRSSLSCQFPSWEGLGVGSWSQCMRESRNMQEGILRCSLHYSLDDLIDLRRFNL